MKSLEDETKDFQSQEEQVQYSKTVPFALSPVCSLSSVGASFLPLLCSTRFYNISVCPSLGADHFESVQHEQ